MSNKANKQTAIKQTLTVAECEATLAGFEQQRTDLIAQHEQHTAKRREISFSASSTVPVSMPLWKC
jgi:hypothetical protein